MLVCHFVYSILLSIYTIIYNSDYSVTIGMANPKSGIGQQVNHPVVLAHTGNEKDLETKRLAIPAFFQST